MLSGLYHQGHSLREVAGQPACTLHIRVSESILSLCVTLISCLAVPDDGLRLVFRDRQPILVQDAETPLGRSILLFGKGMP